MRVTNAMTSNQLLLDLNRNMNALNYLQYQSATGNKIRFASDDPIVAARALKFRTNIAETDQYMSNVDQGAAWLSSTANPVKNILEALVNSGETSIRSLLVSGSNGTNTLSDALIYTNQLKETLNEILGELNTTYAGRYLFSGLKTDEKCIFDEDMPNLEMEVNQSFKLDDIETDYRVYVKLDGQLTVDDNLRADPNSLLTLNTDATGMPQEIAVYRLKLAYDSGISASDIKGFKDGFTLITPIGVSSSDKNAYIPGDDDIHYIEDTGELIFGKNVYDKIVADMNNTSFQTYIDNVLFDANNALQAMGKNNTQAGAADARTAANYLLLEINSLISGTGNLTTLDHNSYEKLIDARVAAFDARNAADDVIAAYANLIPNDPVSQKALTDAIAKAKTTMNVAYAQTMRAIDAAQSIEITYKKSGFEKTDLNPKTYFECTELSANPQKKYSMNQQNMEYEFGVGNKMAVNTLGKDIITTELLKDIYDVINLTEHATLSDRNDLINKIKTAYPNLSQEDVEKRADEQLTNEEKFYTDMITKKFTDLIGKIDTHSTKISQENTSIGSRLSRLELISNRLQDDRVNFEELKTNNENVDMAEAYIRYQSMYSVYQSALQMGAKVVQMTLVNYI